MRARRSPRKTQARASIGKADRTSSGGRGTQPLGGAAARRRKGSGRGHILLYLCCRHSQAPSSPHDCRCGNEYCRLCRSKNTHHAQRHQCSSTTEPNKYVLPPKQLPRLYSSPDVRQMPRSSDEQRTIPHKHYPGSSLYGSDYPGIATCQDAPYISYGCTPPPDRNGILRRVVVKACPAWQAPAQNSYVMKEHVPQ